jgi:hypothetical protein
VIQLVAITQTPAVSITRPTVDRIHAACPVTPLGRWEGGEGCRR